MEKQCIFCGKILGRWEKKTLSCGNTSQTVCKECYDTYSPYSNVERARLAAKTGRAKSKEELQTFVAQMDQVQAEREEEAKNERQKRLTGKKCLRCGGEMINRGEMELKLGRETFFFSDLNRLASGSLDVEVLRCENCGMAEFYIPSQKDGN